MKMVLFIAGGGAIGAVFRYLVMARVGHMISGHLPYGTIVVNVLGSFILGALIEYLALVWSPSQEVRAFLVVGVLGAFTTFSTFSMDSIVLMERGNYALAGWYIAGSVVLSIAALMGGMMLFRQILA
jgi:CrcB protein